jgi:AcrR family transcriptional regulator
MPKRDEAYMLGQRNALTQAAVECLLKKGLSATSMQDVAKAAGVSLGTLYVHFTDKYELVLAACRGSYGYSSGWPWPRKPANTWAEYVSEFDKLKTYLRSDRGRRRLRLSYQIVAELIMNKKNLPGFTEWYDEFADMFRLDLRTLQRNGEISLPLGLQQTVHAHMNLYHGTIYAFMSNHDADLDAMIKSLKSSLALISGVAVQTAAAHKSG